MKDSTSTPKTTGAAQKPLLPLATPRSRRYLWPAYKQILTRTNWPILVGPWRGEVGFEALYWTAFLDQLKADGVSPSRLIPITRGGAGVWYGTPSAVELYAMRTPQETRIETRVQHMKRRMLKQVLSTRWDRTVIRDVAETLGLRRYHVLHPSWMYQSLAPFWDGHQGLAWLQGRMRFDPLPLPQMPEGLTLPERFAAVRFYFRSTFPASPQLAQFATETIRTIAATQPVVLLNAQLHLDDHLDALPPAMPNVYRMTDLCEVTPENNLAVQSAILARSLGFVGTYGGLAQLALRYGKPSVSVYADWHGTALAHKHLSEMLALSLGVPFQVLRIGDLPLLQAVLPHVIAKSPQDVGPPSQMVSV